MSARTVADQISDRLRSELLAGTYPIGRPLREQELAEHFGVSRHPIRKALQKLTLEGLLSARPNPRRCRGGVTVRARKRLADAYAEAARALCLAACVSQTH